MASCHQSLDASAVPTVVQQMVLLERTTTKVLAADLAYAETNSEALADIRANLTQHSRTYFGMRQDLL